MGKDINLCSDSENCPVMKGFDEMLSRAEKTGGNYVIHGQRYQSKDAARLAKDIVNVECNSGDPCPFGYNK